MKDFLATKANIRNVFITGQKYAWELIYFGYCKFDKPQEIIDEDIRATIYSGIGCTITPNNEAFLVEPAFKMLLRSYVAYTLEDESFVQMMSFYVEQRASTVAELVAASCICSFSNPNSSMRMTDHPLFHGLKGTLYDNYSLNFNYRAIIHDHGENSKLTSALGGHQLSSVILNFLLTDAEKNETLLKELINVVLIPCQSNRADIITFAIKRQDVLNNSLPDIIPVIVSVNRFVNRAENHMAQEKLLQDLQNTKIRNLYSSRAQNSNTVQAKGVLDLKDVVKCVERTNTYVRVLFHPWLHANTSSQTLLDNLLSGETGPTSFYDDGFAAVNKNTGIIQVSQNSPAFSRIKHALSKYPQALKLLDSVAK